MSGERGRAPDRAGPRLGAVVGGARPPRAHAAALRRLRTPGAGRPARSATAAVRSTGSGSRRRGGARSRAGSSTITRSAGHRAASRGCRDLRRGARPPRRPARHPHPGCMGRRARRDRPPGRAAGGRGVRGRRSRRRRRPLDTSGESDRSRSYDGGRHEHRHPATVRSGRLRRRSTRLFPPPPEYFETAWYDPPDVIEHKQLARLQQRALAAERGARSSASAGTPRASTRARSRRLDDLWRRAVVHRRRHPQEHRGAPALGRLPGRHPGRRARASRCASTCPGGTTGQSRPTFYTYWDREVGGVLTARALYRQGIRPGDVVLNSWAYGLHNGAFSLRRGAEPLAQLRRDHDEHRQRHQQREAGPARDRVRRQRDPHDRRLPAAPRRGGARAWATTRQPT